MNFGEVLFSEPEIRQVAVMDAKYDPKKIEPKWQAYWESTGLFKVKEDPGKEKYYLLEMFPYPSGQDSYGTRAQLYHWRCCGPLQANARV